MTAIVTDSIPLILDNTTEENGKLQIPATLAKQMIYNYDSLKVLKTTGELTKAALYADGIPITRNHPNAGIVTDQAEVLGFLRNPLMENDELKGILEITDKDLIADIQTQKLKEVSLGFFCNLDKTPGTYNDSKYDATQTKIYPDHVAIVEQGRCSLKDGCGITAMGDAVDSPPDLIGKLDTAIGMAESEWSTVLKDLLTEIKEMVVAGIAGGEITTGDSKTKTEHDKLKNQIDSITKERDTAQAELNQILQAEKDTIINELTKLQDSKTTADLAKLEIDDLRKELDMIRELKTNHLTINDTQNRTIDKAYAKIGAK